jgi:predicted nucleotidyltransferase
MQRRGLAMRGRNHRPIPDVQTIIARVREACESRPEVLCAWLFGSQATGAAGALSDIDVAILARRPDSWPEDAALPYWAGLHAALVHALGVGDDDVDLVFPDEVASPLLAHRATWGGRVVHCRDHRARVDVQCRILRRYLDAAPLRRQQWEALGRAFAGGSCGH